jgi:hypothetical protein
VAENILAVEHHDGSNVLSRLSMAISQFSSLA